MSGVLERMAQRALGTLPAIQPLAAPRFAPPASVVPEHLAKMQDRQALDLQELEADYESSNPSTTPPILRRAEKRTAQQSRQEGEPSQMKLHAEEPEPDEASQRVQKEKPAPERLLKRFNEQSEQQSGAEEHESSHKAIELPLNATPRRPVDQAPRAAMEDIAAVMPHATVEGAPQTEVTASARKPAMEEASLRSNAAATAQFAGLHAALPDGLSEQRTEVHISIGSIELRAPRQETKSSVAPFRPSVSLDDFLRRDRGART